MRSPGVHPAVTPGTRPVAGFSTPPPPPPHLLAGLLDVVKSLHAASPQRMTRVSGPDGSPGSYQKRRYAADYTDNPAGGMRCQLSVKKRGSACGAG